MIIANTPDANSLITTSERVMVTSPLFLSVRCLVIDMYIIIVTVDQIVAYLLSTESYE